MLEQDALGQASLLKDKQVSVKELISASIQQIEALNPKLNAVVSTQFEEALIRAEQLDQSGQFDQPFAGVPILLKDLGQNQAGHLSTSGSRLFADYRAQQTDNYVKRVEELGFIVLGRTNTPEFGFKNISDSSLHGVVNHPRDLTRNAGGSSGGAAAAVASRMVAVAGASDGGGSIRIPASFNGLIGLKPTRGRVPVGPGSFRGWQGASSHFFLTKSVRDTKTLLYHMQTCQLEAPFPLPTLSHDCMFGQLSRPLKIAYYLESPVGTVMTGPAKEAVRQTVQALKDLGHELVELDAYPVDAVALLQSYYLMNSVETAQMFDEIETSLGRVMTPADMEPMTWAIYQSGQVIPAKRYSKTLQDWDRFSHQMAVFHETYDLLLTPTVADVAPTHGQLTPEPSLLADLSQIDRFAISHQQDLIWQMFAKALAVTPMTVHANLTGQPALSLPVYERADGLPIGVQLMGAKGREDLLLAIAEQLGDLGAIKQLPKQQLL